MIRIAILMSVYNGDRYIEEQINSILLLDKSLHNNTQNKLEIDLWVRDDGSTDNTIKILDCYQKRGLLNWYSGTNLGAAGSFIDLIKHCIGYDYYAFSDQDDYWLPPKISHAIDVLEDEKNKIYNEDIADAGKKDDLPMLYGSNAQLVDNGLLSLNVKVYPHKPITEYKLVSCSCGLLGCTMVFNSALAKSIQNHDSPQKMVMHDYYITLVCALLDGKTLYDDSAYILYRQHADNVCGISYNVWKKIRCYFNVFRQRPKLSIADQAAELLNLYAKELDVEKKKWLLRVSEYRKSLITRISLALSPKYHFYSIKRAIPMRMRILLGRI